MIIHQFEDKNLSHFSYAIISDGEMALIDPSRNPEPYYAFGRHHQARVVAVFETHPHADFISSHLEIHQQTGATVLISEEFGGQFPHQGFSGGSQFKLGQVSLRSLPTPGHSPDSISILVVNEQGKDAAVFTGDTLFVGDCGRPDLRENAGHLTASREHLATQLYHSLHQILKPLPDEVVIYPAHGAGSLCGKTKDAAGSSTMGKEKSTNWALQNRPVEDFVSLLLEGLPFQPKYFAYDVELNRRGALPYKSSLSQVPRKPTVSRIVTQVPLKKIPVVDTRPLEDFQRGHLPGSIHLMEGKSFETWLGTLLAPAQTFYLVAAEEKKLEEMIARTAKIGYEPFIEMAFLLAEGEGHQTMPPFPLEDFSVHPHHYTIIDVRSREEAVDPIFSGAINIPLPELGDRIAEIPTSQPIVVHCAGGYRSAAASSILQHTLGKKITLFNLGENITRWLKQETAVI
ncbi:MAG: MBL fold metallo-hydrolase [Chitinophagaceae bacterium]